MPGLFQFLSRDSFRLPRKLQPFEIERLRHETAIADVVEARGRELSIADDLRRDQFAFLRTERPDIDSLLLSGIRAPAKEI